MVSSADRVFFGGFASGLDTNALIDALIAVEGRPIFLAERRRTGIEDEQAAFSRVSSSLVNLLARLAALKDATIVGGRRAKTDQPFNEPSKLSVSAGSTAAVGSFTVDIVSLATPTDVAGTAAVGQAVAQASPLDQGGFETAPVAGTFTINTTEFTIAAAIPSTAESFAATGSGVSTTANLDSAGLTVTPDASGTFTINGKQLSYDATTDSIDDMIQRINTSAADVTATFDAATDKFKLTSKTNGPTLITFADDTGNFLETMSFFDAVPTKIAVEVAGTDLVSLTDVVDLINGAAIGVTASVVNDSDARANLLQLTSGSTITLGSASDTSNFLSMTHLLESPSGTTRTSVRNLGQLDIAKALDEARMETALSASTGSFTINGVSISYDEAADSLGNVITRINESAAEVTATYDVLTDKLIITADSTGSVGIGLVDVTGNFLAAFDVLSATQTLGANASYQIDGGSTRYSTSNSVTNAVTGVTLDFRDTTSSAVTVTVTADTASLRGKIAEFVEQYNSSMTIMADVTKYVENGDDGVLSGDTTMLNMKRNLRSLVTGTAMGLSGDISSLADIGLNFGAVGAKVGETELLLFVTSTFAEAIKDNAEAVNLLLTGFSASASLKAGGTGSVLSITGTPSMVKDSGDYELTTTASGALTMTFQADDGSGLVVTNATVSPGEVNTTLIPGVSITFDDPLVAGVDTIEINALQEGIGKALHEYVNSLTRSGGTMSGRNDSLQTRINDINDQIERMEKRLDAKRAFLIRKFATLEVTMSRLNMQQAALTALVGSLAVNRPR
ncbi:MAG: flagellar filament capping protein FliD [Dehalococcoidia bacterium]